MKENRTNNKENEKQEARMNSSKDLNVIWYFFVSAPKIDKNSRLYKNFPKYRENTMKSRTHFLFKKIKTGEYPEIALNILEELLRNTEKY